MGKEIGCGHAGFVDCTGPCSTTLVVGATGAVGSLVVQQLRARGMAVKATTRRPADAPTIPGVDWVLFDYEQPETFSGAVSGTRQVFLVVRPGDDRPQETAVPFLEKAKEAGVTKVVLLSAMGAELRPDFGLRILERHIEEAGFSFVHLRPNWFMQLFTSGPLYNDLMTTSALHIPAGEARISYIDASDIAAVAAEVLSSDRFDNQGYTLTGPEAIDHHQLVATLSAELGRRLVYVPLTEEQAAMGLKAAGFGQGRIDRLIMFYKLVRSGLCAPVSTSVKTITTREATSFKDFVCRNKGFWMRAAS